MNDVDRYVVTVFVECSRQGVALFANFVTYYEAKYRAR